MILPPTPQVLVDNRDAVRTLYVLDVKSRNLRTPLTQIKNLIVADHVDNFDSGGSLFGGWAPRSGETQALNPQLLVRTGFLKSEIEKKSGPGKKVTKYEVRVGVGYTGAEDSFYARFHQAGAPAGDRKGDLPKREIVGITDDTRDKGIEMIRQYLVKGT